MQLFEITLLLLAIAVVLLQAARRLRVPYPAMLALVGGCVAVLPFAPHLSIEPQLALGAIVAPPDAAAAAAVLQEFNLPRRTMAVLQGESLLNDAVALLAFGLAVSAAVSPGSAWNALLPRLIIAVPGGALLGVAMGVVGVHAVDRVAGTLSSIIVQFLMTFGTWILAERLSLSPIVAVVALAAVVARYLPARTSARDRVNAVAVWSTVVFVLNVLAFLLMGLQARVILTQLQGDALKHALTFAGIVLAVVIGVRFAWVMIYGATLRFFRSFVERQVVGGSLPPARIGLLVSWCGMRGLVTLATAFALPPEFPGRDVIVLSAFTVVLGTLIVQGFTIRPLIALLRIAPDHSLEEEVTKARTAMLDAALEELGRFPGETAGAVRGEYSAARAASADPSRAATDYDNLRMLAVAAERRVLIEWRQKGRILDDAYHLLEEELDRAELHAASVGATPAEG
jgi:NhaP-type Na+/H+ or K+/H+ antiporter